MKLNSYTHTIGGVRRLCEAARNLPLSQAFGVQGAELASALEEVDAHIKELKAHEQALGHTEEQLAEAAQQTQVRCLRYQELFEFNPDGCLVTDTFGIIREASHTAAALLRSRKEFLLDKPLAFFVTGQKKPFYNYLDRLRRQATASEYWEGSLKPARGEPVYVDVAAAAIPNGDGGPVGFLWLLRDVTRRKWAEQTLQAEKDFANSLIETAQAIILVLDDHGRIVRSNQYLHAVSGYNPDELRGQDWCSLFLPEADREAAHKMLFEALTVGKSKGGTYGMVLKDGSRRIVAWSAKALARTGPEGAALLLVGHDVTELQEAQKQALQMERLAAIGQAVTGLTHESRNALQRGQACLEILKLRLKDRPEDLDFLARIQKAQDDLLRLYEEVRLYGAPIQIDRGRCHLAAVWREAWEQVTGQLPAKEAALCEELAGVDLWCLADPFRLVQVFRNLLENAFAACTGPVRVTISCRETVLAGRPALRIVVCDNGPGLNEEQRRHIFEPFYTTKVKGTGLGTSIARRIVEAHGGQIAVANSQQPGTGILITLPRSGIA